MDEKACVTPMKKAANFLARYEGSLFEGSPNKTVIEYKGKSVSFVVSEGTLYLKTSSMNDLVEFKDDDRYWARLYTVMKDMGFSMKKKLYQDHLF